MVDTVIADIPPCAFELEVRNAPSESYALGRLLVDLRDHLSTSMQALRIWYIRTSADGKTVRIGLHTSTEAQLRFAGTGTLPGRLGEDVVINILPSCPSLQETFILKRLPFQLGSESAAKLMDAFLLGSDIAISFISDCAYSLSRSAAGAAFFGYLVSQSFQALELTTEERMAYSAYHRDAIVRFIVLRAGKSQGKASEVIHLLDERTSIKDGMKTCESLDIQYALSDSTRQIDLWLSGVSSACRVGKHDPSLSTLPDPFVASACHIVLFQLLHIMARQLCLSLLEEAEAFTVLHHRMALSEPPLKICAFELTRPPLELEKEPHSVTRFSPNIGPRSPWMLLVEAGSDKGKSLMKAFNDELGPAYWSCAEALIVLRQHERGTARFEIAAKHLDAVRLKVEGSDALTSLLGRFFWGSEAYYHYCQGNLVAAEDVLKYAGECLARAIDAELCLAPCAPLNSDIPLQRARVARRLGDWSRVTRELSLLADLESGRVPLQQRADGLIISYDLIEGMCTKNIDLGTDNWKVLHEYIDLSSRLARLNRWIQSFYLQKGVVIEA